MLRTETGLLQQETDRRTQPCPEVSRRFNRFAGYRHHALNQRFAVGNGAFDGNHGSDVLHQYADIRGTSAGRHFAAGENFGQLFGTAGWVLGRDHAHENLFFPGSDLAQCGNRLRFIVFNADKDLFRPKKVHQNTDTGENFPGMLLHQTVIRRDIRLTLRRIDNQGADKITASFQLTGGREARTAETGNPGLVNTVSQLCFGESGEIRCFFCRIRGIQPISPDADTRRGQPGRMRGHTRLHGSHGAG